MLKPRDVGVLLSRARFRLVVKVAKHPSMVVPLPLERLVVKSMLALVVTVLHPSIPMSVPQALKVISALMPVPALKVISALKATLMVVISVTPKTAISPSTPRSRPIASISAFEATQLISKCLLHRKEVKTE